MKRAKIWLIVIAAYLILGYSFYNDGYYIVLAIWIAIPLLPVGYLIYNRYKQEEMKAEAQEEVWQKRKIDSTRKHMQNHAEAFRHIGVDVDNLTDEEIENNFTNESNPHNT